MQPDLRDTLGKVRVNLFIPESNDLPAVCLQSLVDLLVPLNVSLQLLDPVTSIAGRDCAV